MLTEKIKDILDWFERKSGLEIPTVHPESIAFRSWEALIVLVNFYNGVMVPFRIGFQTAYRGKWLIFDLLGDLLLILDIFLRFNVGYLEHGEYVSDKEKIIQRYSSKSMKRHLAASVPVDILGRIFISNVSPVLLGFLRLPRLLRVHKSFSVFNWWEEKSNINPFLIRMLKLAIIIFFFTHWIACLWFFIGEIGVNSGSSWLLDSSLAEASSAKQYVTDRKSVV